jgi:hypothetical protein
VTREPLLLDWVGDIREFTTASQTRWDRIVLLDPRDEQRRARWRTILSSYTAQVNGLAVGTPQPSSVANSCGDYVVSLGYEVGQIGTVLAQKLNRGHQYIADPAEIITGSLVPSSLLLLAPRQRLDFASVVAIEARLRLLGVRFGILTGRDLAGLSFAAAKTFLARRRPNLPAVTISALDHDRSYARSLPRDRESGSLIIAAHGEGAHLLLPDGVVCGLVGQQEVLGESPLVHGCSDQSCKRARNYGLPHYFLHDIRTQLLV